MNVYLNICVTVPTYLKEEIVFSQFWIYTSKSWHWIFSSFFFHHYSPVDSSRFGSSGNLSQTSSQLSETGQESIGGSELEESFHSYHSTGCHPSANGQQPHTNGHFPANGHAPVGEKELCQLSPEVGPGLKNGTPTERGSSKLQRCDFSIKLSFLHAVMKIDVQ